MKPGSSLLVRLEPELAGPCACGRRLHHRAVAGMLYAMPAAGLGPDDIEAIYRTAFRDCFAEGVA